MTKEEFIEQMTIEVTLHKQMLEGADLKRVQLDKNVVGTSRNPNFNPFLEIDSRYFNIKLLANLQGINSLMMHNPDFNVYQAKIFILCNPQFKILNQVLNYNPYVLEELNNQLNSPLDIAINYARHCEFQERLKNMPKR